VFIADAMVMETSETAGMNWTILDILQWTTAYFKEKGIHSPRLTAELLLAHTLRQPRIYLYTHYDQPLQVDERTGYKALIKRRIQGTPTQYLLGTQEFWSLTFQVTPDVLIPRPETEHLVEMALQCVRPVPHPVIVDLGTGSGIIAISLKKELPQATVYAGDISAAALALAQQNASALLDSPNAITFRQGDLLQPFPNLCFDLIVSNPPYIAAVEYAALSPEIRDYEPKIALYAGEQGLDIYQQLIPAAFPQIFSGGYVLVEIGYGQANAVTTLFQTAGFTVRQVINDYAGIARVVVAQKPA
jgi:release factor glutamine methyltransferase